MPDSADITKMGIAALAAGSLGGFGGHTIGSGGDTPAVNQTTVESCQAFVDHAARHERSECDIRILNLHLEKD